MTPAQKQLLRDYCDGEPLSPYEAISFWLHAVIIGVAGWAVLIWLLVR